MHLAALDGAGIIASVKYSSVSERTQWAQRFYQSGLTQAEFAARHGLVLSTLQRWLRQNPAQGPSPHFTEIKLPAVSRGWAAEIVHADGTLVRLAHDIPAHLLQELLSRC